MKRFRVVIPVPPWGFYDLTIKIRNDDYTFLLALAAFMLLEAVVIIGLM